MCLIEGYAQIRNLRTETLNFGSRFITRCNIVSRLRIMLYYLLITVITAKTASSSILSVTVNGIKILVRKPVLRISLSENKKYFFWLVFVTKIILVL